jgi:hypothetical protein
MEKAAVEEKAALVAAKASVPWLSPNTHSMTKVQLLVP